MRRGGDLWNDSEIQIWPVFFYVNVNPLYKPKGKSFASCPISHALALSVPFICPLIPALTHQNDELLLYADLSPSDESHILLTPLHVDETETDEDIFYVCVCGVFMLGWSVNLWHGKISFVVGRKCPSFYQDQKSFWRNSLETGGHMT